MEKEFEELPPNTYRNAEGYLVRIIPEARASRLGVGRRPIRSYSSIANRPAHFSRLDNEFSQQKKDSNEENGAIPDSPQPESLTEE